MKLLGFSLRCTADGNRLFPSTLHGLTPISTFLHPSCHVLIVFCFDLEQQEVIFKPVTKTYFDIKDNTDGIYDHMFNMTGTSEQGNKRRKSLSKIILLIQTKANGNIEEEQRFIIHDPSQENKNKTILINPNPRPVSTYSSLHFKNQSGYYVDSV